MTIQAAAAPDLVRERSLSQTSDSKNMPFSTPLEITLTGSFCQRLGYNFTILS